MKKRIQYLYEKGGDDAWFQMMLNAENLSDLLTRAEYTQKTYEQDRKSLEKYSNTIQQVANLEAQDVYKRQENDTSVLSEEAKNNYDKFVLFVKGEYEGDADSLLAATEDTEAVATVTLDEQTAKSVAETVEKDRCV